MSDENKIDIKYLQALVLQESENDSIQELDSDFYNSISKFIGNLNSLEYEGVEAKIKKTLVDMVTELTTFLLKMRLEKASLDNSSSPILLDVEKYILNSQREMEERKEIILSRILSGKSKLLEPNDE
ncbi:hypothetical protein AAA799O18_00418 [Marine Group I thaumarchaeote SCGC AAA799-O18]|jgi:DNA replication factor GINS|nr:hypothetical protein AAA799O18_00418 [Marine Group I thaumarchaeote SCGC AAA799-O18]